MTSIDTADIVQIISVTLAVIIIIGLTLIWVLATLIERRLKDFRRSLESGIQNRIDDFKILMEKAIIQKESFDGVLNTLNARVETFHKAADLALALVRDVNEKLTKFSERLDHLEGKKLAGR